MRTRKVLGLLALLMVVLTVTLTVESSRCEDGCEVACADVACAGQCGCWVASLPTAVERGSLPVPRVAPLPGSSFQFVPDWTPDPLLRPPKA